MEINGKKNQSLQLQREEYDKLLDMLPSLLGYVETFKNLVSLLTNAL